MRGFLVMILSFAFFMGGLDLASSPAVAQTGSYSLEGQVCSWDERWSAYRTDGCLGGALPDAVVTLSRSSGLPAGVGDVEETDTTDDSGHFIFGGLEEGEYTLRVERTGFEAIERSVEVPSDFVQVSLEGLSVTATGNVSDAEGAPVEGAEIAFYHHQSVRAKSGADGSFSADVVAGWQSVQVRHPDHRALHEYLLVDGDAPFAFELPAAPERTAEVTGTVLDQNGAPVADATIDVYQYGHYGYDYGYGDGYESSASKPQGDSMDVASSPAYPYYDDGYQRTTTDGDGSFRVSVYAGWVDLQVWKNGYSRAHQSFEVADGDSRSVSVELLKFPDKTARIVGQVTGADGQGLKWVSIHVESPRYGISECSIQTAANGSSGGGVDGSPGQVEPAPDRVAASSVYYPGPYHEGCAIEVKSDGSFEGLVTPGYTILRVHYEHYRSCTETRHSDGSFERKCGQDHFSYAKVLDLEANATTRHDVRLTPRPGPDATISGYVVDDESGQALAGVQVSFSNQQSYGYAYASTDQDGSFKVRVQSGYHQVSVYADGYLRWEGVVQVGSGQDVPFDIHLTPGQDQYGGCCYYGPYPAYAEDAAGDRGAVSEGSAGAPGMTTAPSAGSSTSSQGFEDLRGGLGPYDADKRAKILADSQRDTPAPGAALVGLALLAGALVVLRRRDA